MTPKILDKDACSNVLVVAITPRDRAGQVDLIGVRRNVAALVAAGIDFIMPECGTGLVYDATLAEYEAVVGAFVAAAGDRAWIVPGIGPGFGRSLEMGRIARSLGVSGVMIMPVVGPASAAGVRRGLQLITEKVALPTILYQRRLDIMPVEQVIELCRLDGVVGLKYAVDDLESFKRVAAAAGEQAAMICGMAEDPSIEYMQNGAVGFSSGMANFVPGLSLELWRQVKAANLDEAQRLRDLMVPFEDFRGENAARYSGSALHAAMDIAGLAGGPVIPFAEDVADADLGRVQAMMAQLLAEENILKERKSI
jgi:4-hydroxy-tetrahydrodipicolinate synthase